MHKFPLQALHSWFLGVMHFLRSGRDFASCEQDRRILELQGYFAT